MRILEDLKLDGKFLLHGYHCFVDPIIASQVIGADQPVDMELIELEGEIETLERLRSKLTWGSPATR